MIVSASVARDFQFRICSYFVQVRDMLELFMNIDIGDDRKTLLSIKVVEDLFFRRHW